MAYRWLLRGLLLFFIVNDQPRLHCATFEFEAYCLVSFDEFVVPMYALQKMRLHNSCASFGRHVEPSFSLQILSISSMT